MPPLIERMQRIAKRAYRALDLSGYARIDVRMDEEGRIYVLEANPNPNMAYGEDFSESAEAHGISYERLLDRLIALGLRWKPARTGELRVTVRLNYVPRLAYGAMGFSRSAAEYRPTLPCQARPFV